MVEQQVVEVDILSGDVTLQKGDTLYIYVGGQGGSTNTFNSGRITIPGGFNGGGIGHGGGSRNDHSGGGGGATDVRVNSDSLFSRVIVAGGGAGGTGALGIDGPGAGAGGGTSGIDGIAPPGTAVRSGSRRYTNIRWT